MRVGLIGAGGIGQFHLKGIASAPDAKLVAVADVVAERAQVAGRTYGAAAYADYREMLAREDLQALFVCVPPFAHGTIEEEAAGRGIHMLVEKPVGLTLDEARRKQAAIAQAGVIAAAGYCLRYSSLVEKVRAWLGGGFRPLLAEAHYWGSTPSTPWLRDFARSGGQLVEQATHVVDLLRYFVGEVTEVSAGYTHAGVPDDPAFTAPTAGSVSLKFADGPVGSVSHTCMAGTFAAGVNLVGPDGAIQYTYSEARLIQGGSVIIEKPAGDMYAIQDHAFLKAIATRDASLVRSTYADAIRTLAITLAANQSAAEGHPVRLSAE